MRYSCHGKKNPQHIRLIWELNLLICLPYSKPHTACDQHRGLENMRSSQHLSSLQPVQSGGLETALARPLLSSGSLLVPPYSAEHRDSLQRPGSPVTSGPTQPCPSQQNYKETFWWNYLFHGKREIQAKLGSSCRFISVLIPFRLLQKEHCKILRK